MVLSCIDPRFQPKVYKYLKDKNLTGKYSSFTIAGAAIGVTAKKFKKWHTTFFDNLSTSIKLHKIDRLIVINHKDCGAAKIINCLLFNILSLLSHFFYYQFYVNCIAHMFRSIQFYSQSIGFSKKLLKNKIYFFPTTFLLNNFFFN